MTTLVKRKRGRPRRDERPDAYGYDTTLVNEYQQRPALYDRDNAYNRDRDHVEEQWREIAHAVNDSVTSVKDRINQLRNRYNLEKRRVDMLEQQNKDRPIASQWVLYNHLSFLDRHVKVRGGAIIKQDHSMIIHNTRTSDANNASENNDDDDYETERQESTPPLQEQPFIPIRLPPKPTTNSYNNNNNNNTDVATNCHQTNILQENHQNMHVAPVYTTEKYIAFGQFVSYSLIEMNENDALRLIDKFTRDLINTKLQLQNGSDGINV